MAPRYRSLWPCLALCLALAPVSTLAAATNDFSFYPDNAENCLNESADASACTGETNAELNDCLCGNTNDFVTNTAKCLGKEDPDDVDLVYTTMKSACNTSGSNFTVTEDEWQAAAAEGGSAISVVSSSSASSTKAATSSATDASSDSATTTAATVATSQSAFVTTTSGGKTITVYPTQTADDDDDQKSGLSTPVTIGIGVGGAVLGAAIVGFVFFFLLRRRMKGGEETRPMLSDPQPQQHGGGGGGGVPFAQGSAYQDNKPAWAPAGGYNPGADGKGWGTPTAYTGAAGAFPPPGYTPGYAPGPGLPPQQGVAPGAVFEMEGSVTAQAVEMPGSEVHSAQPAHQQTSQQGWRYSK